jgi:hypothetical protein
MRDTEVKEKLKEYANEYIRGYTEAIDDNYAYVKQTLLQLGLEVPTHLPLYNRALGVDVALAALCTPDDFYVFFLRKPGVIFTDLRYAQDARDLDRTWSVHTQYDIRVDRVKTFLGLADAKILSEVDASGGNSFLTFDREYLKLEGRRHGQGRGNQDGATVASHLPNLLADHARAEQLRRFSVRYTELQALTLSAQERGRRFEVLWRDVLAFYGWMPKKIRISGEENDFTAIYQGIHILGEVRWFSEPMNGGRMREFVAKLDPRPQTIGLFISTPALTRARGVSSAERPTQRPSWCLGETRLTWYSWRARTLDRSLVSGCAMFTTESWSHEPNNVLECPLTEFDK